MHVLRQDVSFSCSRHLLPRAVLAGRPQRWAGVSSPKWAGWQATWRQTQVSSISPTWEPPPGDSTAGGEACGHGVAYNKVGSGRLTGPSVTETGQ